VKVLMALLEQNKACTTLDLAEDDKILENTYMKASTIPKSHTDGYSEQA